MFLISTVEPREMLTALHRGHGLGGYLLRIQKPELQPRRQVVLNLQGQLQITAALQRVIVVVQMATRHVKHHEKIQKQRLRNQLVQVHHDNTLCENNICKL